MYKLLATNYPINKMCRIYIHCLRALFPLCICSFLLPFPEASLLEMSTAPRTAPIIKANKKYDLSKKAYGEFVKLSCTTGTVHPTPSQAFIFQLTCSHATGLAINT